jgi:glucose-6-phosphate isomerase
MSITSSSAWQSLRNHVAEIDLTHLRDLLLDTARSSAFTAEHNGIFLDYARQRITTQTMDLLFALAEEAGVEAKIAAMAAGEKINSTEGRAVLHMALRAPAGDSIRLDGHNVVDDVQDVLGQIRSFSDKVRSGGWVGATGKTLTDVLAIGIGGSYLGPEFAYESFRTDPGGAEAAAGRRLRFLANVDPVDVTRALEGYDPESTLVIVISKTFTTAETMLNARTLRAWLTKNIDGANETIVRQHMVAVSTNTAAVTDFGIDAQNIFGFWDWVGGRYSVWSAVGALPLALQYGFDIVAQFLAGAHDVDKHFTGAPLRENIPILLGLLGVWNSSFLGAGTRALLPYSQALLKLAPHIQQVDMESNGKRVGLDGEVLDFETGEINFGEPGTNGQHSFYQLIHQGRVIPCDFIGFKNSQQPRELPGEAVSNHDELMANFFAQPDALAYGKTEEEVRAEGVAEDLVPHKVFTGNRPSSSLLLEELTPYTTGQILALFEHRTAVQGFVWGINSFDQWGVELGKSLAKQVRTQLTRSRKESAPVQGFNSSTTSLLNRYLE